MLCLLCNQSVLESFEVDRPKTKLWHCKDCFFIFKDPDHHVSNEREKTRYLEHNNGDLGHQNFLQPVVQLIQTQLAKSCVGLDWGCGPVAVLQKMLIEAGYNHTHIYDPYFAPRSWSHEKYDFITMTEVIEHMKSPKKDFEVLKAILKTQGSLIVMSDFWNLEILEDMKGFFQRWYYRQDPTHVAFYSQETFVKSVFFKNWVAKKINDRIFILYLST
jgi:Methyltransferase domain